MSQPSIFDSEIALPSDTLAKRELDYASRLKVAPVGGDIDLF